MQKIFCRLTIGFVYCSCLISCTTMSNSTNFHEDIYAEDGMSYDSEKLSHLGYDTSD